MRVRSHQNVLCLLCDEDHPTRFWKPRDGRPSISLFADALRAAMAKANITPSELAKRVWGVATDTRGYTVARNRDRIGHYLNGTSYPNAENLAKLAKAVGVPVETLAIETPGRVVTGRPPQRVSLHDMQASGLLQTTMPLAPAPLARFQADRMISPELAITLTQMILREEEKKRANETEKPASDEDAARLGTVVGGTDLNHARGN